MSIRTIYLLLATFAICSVISTGQDRPWVFRGRALPGPTPKVCTAAGGVLIFDRVAMRSIDHAATLDTIRDMRGDVCDFVDFAGGITFGVTYDAAKRTGLVYFSQGGNSWMLVDSISNIERPTSIVASATEWFMSTENGSTIHRVGETTSTIKGPASDPIRQMLLLGTTLVTNVAGKQISYTTDYGQNWKTIPLPGVGVLHAVGGTLYAASSQGVKKIDLSNDAVTEVGIWKVKSGAAPATLDLDSYLGNLHTIAIDTAYQMYRLDPADATWTPLAYPLPCRKAVESPSLMSIEAGWAIAAVNVTEGRKDTSGIYAYDLNDFTSVSDAFEQNASYDGIVLTGTTAEIDMGAGVVASQIMDLSGRCTTTCSTSPSGRVRVEVSPLASGMYLLVSQSSSGPRLRPLLIP